MKNPRDPILRASVWAGIFACLLASGSCRRPAAPKHPKQKQQRVTIDAARDAAPLRHFWNACGFTPAKEMLTPVFRENMLYLGSVPHRGDAFFRPLRLLDLVSASDLDTDAPVYDWSKLDAALDLVAEAGFKPLFSLTGNPEPFFASARFDYRSMSDAQVHAWRRFVKDLATHCIGRYGRATVESWLFETWNEPVANTAFFRYYDACSEGLRDADPGLRFGGLGNFDGWKGISALLEHCSSQSNFFSHENGTRLDFISLHTKADAERMVIAETGNIRRIWEHFPQYAHTPFFNDEADREVNWYASLPHRALPGYAAFLAGSANLHQRRIVEDLGVPYPLLSTDNAFIGDWGQRTQLAVVQNGSGFALLKKPAHNVLTMLSLLGDTRLADDSHATAASGVLATRLGRTQIAVLVYHYLQPQLHDPGPRFQLHIEHLPFRNAMLAHYRIDAQHGNPYALWLKMNLPPASPPDTNGTAEPRGASVPDSRQLAELRRGQELTLFENPREVAITDGKFSLDLDLPDGVSLILLSEKPDAAPEEVADVQLKQFPGLSGQPEMMVTWKPSADRMLRTYEVLFSEKLDGEFRRINAPDLIATAFIVPAEVAAKSGFYRVRAVDFWNRAGEAPVTVGYDTFKGKAGFAF